LPTGGAPVLPARQKSCLRGASNSCPERGSGEAKPWRWLRRNVAVDVSAGTQPSASQSQRGELADHVVQPPTCPLAARTLGVWPPKHERHLGQPFEQVAAHVAHHASEHRVADCAPRGSRCGRPAARPPAHPCHDRIQSETTLAQVTEQDVQSVTEPAAARPARSPIAARPAGREGRRSPGRGLAGNTVSGQGGVGSSTLKGCRFRAGGLQSRSSAQPQVRTAAVRGDVVHSRRHKSALRNSVGGPTTRTRRRR
jgi:hypothetical protein